MTPRPPSGSLSAPGQACTDGPAGTAAPAVDDDQGPDEESRTWVRRLNPHHPDRADAIADLHALLLRAARFEVRRRSASASHLRGGDHGDLAQQSADDALVAVLAKLDQYRGASRFTTWVYKFALLEAAVAVRRRSWQGREIPVTTEGWAAVAEDHVAGAQDGVAARETLAAVGAAIDRDLSHHQRDVLLALTVHEVPIDVLAERLGSTRGALYKTLHDARRKLRTILDGEIR